MLDITYDGQPAHRTRKREAELPITIHRNQVIRRRQRHVGALKMQDHRRHLHLRLPGEIEARVEERELRGSLQVRRPGPESVPQRHISGSRQSGHGRARIHYHASAARRVELEKRRRDARDTGPTHRNAV